MARAPSGPLAGYGAISDAATRPGRELGVFRGCSRLRTLVVKHARRSRTRRTDPFRKELAAIALGTARERQFQNETARTWSHEIDKAVYSAALAGAADLPEEIAQWALEMAGRRPLFENIVSRVAAFRKKEAEEHRQKLATDPEYRARMKAKRSFSPVFPAAKKLPPWALGPRRHIENQFRETILGGGALQALLRVRPDVASELILACLIEDSPEEDYNRHPRIDDELGLQYDHDGYPTSYWKTPFYYFLRCSPNNALAVLLDLVNFCTDRRAEGVVKQKGTPTTFSFTFNSGTTREFVGGLRVFSWSQEIVHSTVSYTRHWRRLRSGFATCWFRVLTLNLISRPSFMELGQWRSSVTARHRAGRYLHRRVNAERFLDAPAHLRKTRLSTSPRS
jgi:hypothetical protein